MVRLPKTSPIVLLLNLNFAVFQAETKRNLNKAIEIIEDILIHTFEDINVFAMDSREGGETKKIINLMQKNLIKWNSQAEAEEEEEMSD